MKQGADDSAIVLPGTAAQPAADSNGNGGRDIDYPVFLAIAVVAGPTLFWAFVGLGLGLTVLGWAAGIASTGILATRTYGYLLASSDGHGFDYWLFLTLIVAATLGAFCVTPYALVRGAVGRRLPGVPGQGRPAALRSSRTGHRLGAAPHPPLPTDQQNPPGRGAAVLAGDLLREDVAVDVRVDGGEAQAVEFVRLQRFHLPLHRAAGGKAVAASEGRPPGVAALSLGLGQLVGPNLVVGQQHPLGPAPAPRARRAA
ncbi:hypothetical protein AB0F18_29195 [Streptomyces sp. NPDC029216]|uniref:hypothetical protein n=1 Tax=Streptomyces sp. NPDC029216 TaxID=3154701 RepID=UPI0033FC8F34